MDELMLSYVHEQPDVLERIVGMKYFLGNEELAGLFPSGSGAGGIKRVYIMGSGSSLNAAYAVQIEWEKATGRPVTICDPMELMLRFQEGLAGEGALVIGVSQSGASSTTVASLARARAAGTITWAVTAAEDSPLARTANRSIIVDCGEEKVGPKTKGYSGTVAVLLLMAQEIARYIKASTGSERSSSYDDFDQIPDRIRGSQKQNETAAKELARRIKEARYGFVIGSGSNYGTAREGALKIMETAKIPVLSYDVENAMHGPFNALCDDGFVIVLDSGEPLAERMDGLARILTSMGAKGGYVSLGRLSQFDTRERPLKFSISYPDPVSDVVPVQLLSYYLALEKGVNPVASGYDRQLVSSIIKL